MQYGVVMKVIRVTWDYPRTVRNLAGFNVYIGDELIQYTDTHKERSLIIVNPKEGPVTVTAYTDEGKVDIPQPTNIRVIKG
jgi:hypothetical protein